ncbi:MAG: sensor histidine kinase [Anaerolineae bacterium]|nr:sensor histidine kinase [Anaerolineae bacterium]
MDIQRFFYLNYELVLFVYGLVYFVLGLTIALQSRGHSRLEMAGSFRWLSLFGLTHGLHEWALLLIPMYAAAGGRGVAFLSTVRVLLLAFSFAALFQFGAELLHHRYPRLRWAPVIITVAWLAGFLANGVEAASVDHWQTAASSWARYLLALPGALVAAWGLREQARRQIRPLGLRRIYEMLQMAGIALVAYAVFSGLFVQGGDFFPANVINQRLLLIYTGVPAPVYRSIIGLVLVIAIIRVMEVFKLEVDRLIAEMKTEQQLATERERIARDLHDGALQRVYTAGLLVEAARHQVGSNRAASEKLDWALEALNEAIEGLRTTMGDLRPAPDTISLAEGLRRHASDPRLVSLMNVTLELDLPGEGAGLNPAQVSHILSIVSEALANAARHSAASQVALRAVRENGTLFLSIEDNGIGLQGEREGGYGLRNMRDRARLLGGQLLVNSKPNDGTRVTLVAPWEES